MIGRITSKPNFQQRRRASFFMARAITWRLIDIIVDKAKEMNQRCSDLPEPTSRPEVTTCVFHVFFLTLDETEEHLSRLRNEPVRQDSAPKRSRLVSKLRTAFIRPIDRTAAKVSRGDT